MDGRTMLKCILSAYCENLLNALAFMGLRIVRVLGIEATTLPKVYGCEGQ